MAPSETDRREGRSGEGRSRPREGPEYEEVTLADIVRVLYRRRIVLVSVFLVCLLVGVSVTAFSEPTYTSEATMIPLEHSDIISNWLSSRHAAELVVEDMGDRVMPALYPDRWDPATQSFEGQAPSTRAAGAALASHVSVSQAGGQERFLVLSVTMSDPQLSRDVASGYVETLDDLRPRLENITRQEAFNRYYTGDNEQQAQRRAETTAEQKDYWIMLDEPLPGSASGSGLVLNLSLAGVLGVMLGVFAAFFADWVNRFRAEAEPFRVPGGEEGEGGGPPSSEGQRDQGSSSRY